MICYYCGHKACAKIGGAKGNILKAMLGLGCWEKTEKYVCKKCYEQIEGKSQDELIQEMKIDNKKLDEEILRSLERC